MTNSNFFIASTIFEDGTYYDVVSQARCQHLGHTACQQKIKKVGLVVNTSRRSLKVIQLLRSKTKQNDYWGGGRYEVIGLLFCIFL